MFGRYRANVPYLKRSGVTKALSKPPDRRTRLGKAAPRTYKAPSKGVRSDFWRDYRKALVTCPPKTKPYESRICSVIDQNNQKNRKCTNLGPQKSR